MLIVLAMGTTRINTLVIDFSVLPIRPNPGEIEKFLDGNIKLDWTTVKNLQLHNIRNCALIEMGSLEAAEKLAAQHHLKHSMTVEKKKFLIPVHMEDSAVNVRIHDVPPHVPNVVVAEHMKKYGNVKSVARELWKKYFQGKPNGVRVVRIELNNHVPSYIKIDGEMTSVTYRNQISTCRHCDRRAHPKQKCSEAAAAEKTKQAPAAVPSSDDSGLQQQQRSANQQQQLNSVADNNVNTVQRKRGRSPDSQQIESATSSEASEMESLPDVDEQGLSFPDWMEYRLKKFDRARAKKKNAVKKLCDM